MNKTVLSLEAMAPRLHEFDYILRTNLSSFYVFPRLLKFLETLPKTQCYSGSNIGGNVVSGSGYIISPDVARLIIDHKQELLDRFKPPEDDLILGDFITDHHIVSIAHARMDFGSPQVWDAYRNRLPDHIFQFRVKTFYNRLVDDVYIHSQLFKMFYPHLHLSL